MLPRFLLFVLPQKCNQSDPWEFWDFEFLSISTQDVVAPLHATVSSADVRLRPFFRPLADNNLQLHIRYVCSTWKPRRTSLSDNYLRLSRPLWTTHFNCIHGHDGNNDLCRLQRLLRYQAVSARPLLHRELDAQFMDVSC